MLQLSLWSLPSLLTAAVLLAVLWKIRGADAVPGIYALRGLVVAVVLWALAETLESMLRPMESRVLLAKLRMVLVCLVPLAWFAFALTYSQQRVRANRLALNLAAIVPLATVLITFSNEAHGLLWANLSLIDVGGYRGMIVEHGAWFPVHVVYSSALVLIATTILAFALSQSAESSTPIIAVIAAPLCGAGANAFALSAINPFPWFDYSTVGLALASVILYTGVLRYGLLNRSRIRRDRVLEALHDGVLVARSSGELLDANAAALRIFSLERSALAQQNINALVPSLPLLRINERSRSTVEITRGAHAYEVRASMLDPHGPASDVALVFRDVTRRRVDDQQRRETQKELETLALTDALTNLHNRRVFMSRLNEEIGRVQRHGATLSVLLFDLDHFKAVNDRYGHDTGDEVLKTVARCLEQVKRVTDVAARLGGEEFALLLPETGQPGALQLAQRLREKIAGSETMTSGGLPLTVTASIGVATVNRNSRQIDDLLQHADGALYAAKDSGRNRVCIAETV